MRIMRPSLTPKILMKRKGKMVLKWMMVINLRRNNLVMMGNLQLNLLEANQLKDPNSQNHLT